jgi:low temperature requirement protein LtrA
MPAVHARPAIEEDLGGEARVTPLELFFDLVFVFAITQVTGMISDDPTWGGLGRGLLVLAVLWWCWAAYAWLTNTVDPEEGAARLVVFVAMGALLVVSLAVPGAFDDDALLFALAYMVVRVLHAALYVVASTEDEPLRAAVRNLLGPALGGPVLLIAASAFDGAAQGAIWIAAIVLDMGWPLVSGMEGWRLSPAHFAERHGLIIIIALGESIVAVGIGAEGLGLDAGVLVPAALAIGVSAALWWAYFDVVAPVAEHRLEALTGVARAELGRDSYSYLHLPMVAGIVLFAVGVKKTLGHSGDELATVPAVCLAGGVALYLLAHILFRLRNVGSLNRQRLVVAALLLAFVPAATEAPALVSLGVVFALCAALIAYEAIVFAESRERVRTAR